MNTDWLGATRRAWVEVDLAALRANCRTLIRHLPEGCRILPMVKADGYGIGAVRTVRALSDLGPLGFGVATLAEAMELRREGWGGRILVFTPVLPEELAESSRAGLELVMYGSESLASCAQWGRENGTRLSVHVEIDTGMGRSGVPWQEAERWAHEVRGEVRRGGVRVAGTLTHFHSADSDPGATAEQWRRFEAALERLREAGVDPGLVHAANSAGAMGHPETCADCVRPGIYLYGGGTWEPAPRTVLIVRARVLDVRDVPPGTTVSYGATWRTTGRARLATLGIGYADGLRRELSNRGRVLIRGRAAPIRGVVCMDSTVVDVTEHPDRIRAGDVATILGRDGEAELGLEAMAEACGTISYEILTGWSDRLPRIEVESRRERPRRGSDPAHGDGDADSE